MPSILRANASIVSAVLRVNLANAIFVAQQRGDLRVEDLPRDLSRLLQNFAAVFRIRVVAEVGAFVDEALRRAR